MDTPIASLHLTELTPSGEHKPIHIQVWCPYDADGAWACSVFMDGLDSKPRTIYGEDSLQALCLALRMIRSELEGVLERGGRLIDSEASEFPIQAYFGKL